MRNSFWRRAIFFIFLFSIALNILTIVFDFLPSTYNRYQTRYFQDQNDFLTSSILEEKIYQRALEMAQSDEVTMVWSDPNGLTNKLFDILDGKENRDFVMFNYPRALLIKGLADYAIAKNNTEDIQEIENIFEDYINDSGQPNFIFNKVDQVIFGEVALTLFNYTANEKYIKFGDYVYNKIHSWINEETGIVYYRQDQQIQLVDVVGQINPFLVNYFKIKGDNSVLNLAKRGIDYFITNGKSDYSCLPFHGILIESNYSVGPNNWGRGIGWYYLGLAPLTNYDPVYKLDSDCLNITLERLKLESNLWSQFPGTSNRFDSTTSTMIMLGQQLSYKNSYSRNQILLYYNNYINDKGGIFSGSGDTYGINKYSRSFGESEVSQGILLSLLATTY